MTGRARNTWQSRRRSAGVPNAFRLLLRASLWPLARWNRMSDEDKAAFVACALLFGVYAAACALLVALAVTGVLPR